MPTPRRSWRPGPRAEVRADARASEHHQRSNHGTLTAATVDCGIYAGGRRVGTADDITGAVREAEHHDGGFVWLGLHDPDDATVETVGAIFGLHELAVEDAIHAHQRAKLETYEDSLFLVLKTARYIDSTDLVEIGEILVFMTDRFVVAVRYGEASPLHEVRARIESEPELLRLGPSAILHGIADRVVDDYAPVLEGIEDDIEEIEADVFGGHPSGGAAERIYRLKREVLSFRRAVQPLDGPLELLSSTGHGLPVAPEAAPYFADVHDHLRRDAERVHSFDDLLTGVLQANLTQISLRDNADMRKISAWAAILAVPTMVFGLYGMNFDHMPELHTHLGYPLTVIATVVLCVALYLRLKKSGWL